MSKVSRSRRRKERDKRVTPSPRATAAAQDTKPVEGAHEDDFFARGEENGSFPPSSRDAAEPEIDESLQRRLRPEVIERRARLRRVVTWIVGAAAVLTSLVGVKALQVRSRLQIADTALSVPHQVVASITLSATPEAELAPAPVEPTAVEAVPVQTAPIDPAPPEPARAVETQPPAEPLTAAAPSKAEVRRLIQRGRMRDGIAAARLVLEADSSDAETYLLLGAALQELGQWKESMAVFGKCVAEATKGPKGECMALRAR